MHGNRKYKWEEWLKNKTTNLMRGVDYTCSQANMVYMVRNAASRRKIRVKVVDTGSAIRIEVPDAIPHTSPPSITCQPNAQTLAPAN